MAFIDDLAIRFYKRAPVTGEAPDVARGRKASRKIGLLMGVNIAAAICVLAGGVTCMAGLFGFAFATMAAGAVTMLASAGLGKLSVYGANKVFDRHGTHVNAYLDPLYPDITAERVAGMKPAAVEFNSEAAVKTAAPVTTMKPLKLQTRKPAEKP